MLMDIVIWTEVTWCHQKAGIYNLKAEKIFHLIIIHNKNTLMHHIKANKRIHISKIGTHILDEIKYFAF